MSTLKLFAFGPPRLVRGNAPLDISLRKDMALLVYLAVTRQPHSRDALATLLWPDSDQQAGRSNLRRALYRLNSQLPSGALIATAKTVEVDPDAGLWVDVEAYDAHIAACLPADSATPVSDDCLSRLTDATELYTDDFLAGFTLPDSPQFDEWQFFQTEGLRQSLAEVLESLVSIHQRRGEFDRAIPHARRRLLLDPLHEPAHRDLMQLYAWTDQQAAALRQYEECVRIFEEEFGVPPEDETVALYEAIRTRQIEPPKVVLTEPAPVPATELPPHERYVAEELLATGGQGKVYRGIDRVTGDAVVIKRLRPELLTDSPHHVTRFIREGETLRRLNHPNIVRMLSSLDVEGQYSIVMEYVPGGTLRGLLNGPTKLPVERVLDIALELADALSRAHHLGIFHRDLKPGNVLMAGDGTPRLTDFGLARLEHDDTHLTQTGSTIGSPAYMSPEALRGRRFEARSDVWSFGVVLYEMLAGRRPFEGEQITPILVSILEDPVPAITQFRPDVPPALVDLVQRMLTKDPGQRIASMRLVAAELEAIRGAYDSGSSIAVPAPTPIEWRSPQPATPRVDYKLEQEIRFCTSFDGTRIAYATIGKGPPLVKTANYLTHLEHDWVSPIWRHWLGELTAHHTFIRYDERGSGLSDWDVTDLSFEAWVRDLETIVDRLGLERFPLLGISQGGAVAIAYAARHPERVSGLILYGAYARGWLHRDLTDEQREEEQMMLSLMRIGWGRDNPAFRQFFAAQFQPDASPEQLRALDTLMRVSATPENAVALEREMHTVDVRHLAPQVVAPTLIVHPRGDGAVPFEEGRLLASLIPQARFVPLESNNHILVENEPAWTQFRTELRRFLDTDPPTPAPSLPAHGPPQSTTGDGGAG